MGRPLPRQAHCHWPLPVGATAAQALLLVFKSAKPALWLLAACCSQIKASARSMVGVSKLAFDNTAAMSCEPRPSFTNAACKAMEGEFWAKA